MTTRYRPTTKPSPSLHGKTVREIANAGASTRPSFEEGSPTIESVDSDLMAVLLLRPEKGHGVFERKHMSLKHSLGRYHEYSLGLVNELYGDHTLTYSGYLTVPYNNSLIEMFLGTYCNGEPVYSAES